MSALQVAIINQHLFCVQLLLCNHQTDVNITAMFNTSPCHIAAKEPDMLPILKALLANERTNADLEDDDKATPLIFAITTNNIRAIHALLEWHFAQRAAGKPNSIGLNKKRDVWNNNECWTPLDWAIKVTKNKQVQKILEDALLRDKKI